MPRLFISHSSRDADLATHLVALLRSALNLSAGDIRCTSVPGHSLPAGSRIDQTLRREILDADVFVGLLTRSGRESSYVLFELGARWGAGKHLIPLISPGADGIASFGPLDDVHSLRCDNRAQMYQFVHEVGQLLDIDLERASVYQARVEDIVSWTGGRSDPAEGDHDPRRPGATPKSRVHRRGSLYYLTDPGHEEHEGPFCPACFEERERLITVHEVTRPFKFMGDVRCRVCKSFYKTAS